MKYLNLGCGSHYLKKEEWTNVDFVCTGEGVIECNLINGIPFDNSTFDLVYNSHVLEHFTREDGEKFIIECFRVLKPNGILRVVVPDLETIVRNYLHFFEEGIKQPSNKSIQANYDWILLEMFDQASRNFSGGRMARYLHQTEIANEDFVFERIGEEGKSLRKSFLAFPKNGKNNYHEVKNTKKDQAKSFKGMIKNYLTKKLKVDEKAMEIGKFRMGGEVHQWMYDRYSLSNLLNKAGGYDVVIRDAFASYNSNWATFEIDGKNGTVRKPDSLFMEALKK